VSVPIKQIGCANTDVVKGDFQIPPFPGWLRSYAGGFAGGLRGCSLTSPIKQFRVCRMALAIINSKS